MYPLGTGRLWVRCAAMVVPSDKGRAIQGFVICKNRDLDPLNPLNGLVLGYYQPSPEVLNVLRKIYLVIIRNYNKLNKG